MSFGKPGASAASYQDSTGCLLGSTSEFHEFQRVSWRLLGRPWRARPSWGARVFETGERVMHSP